MNWKKVVLVMAAAMLAAYVGARLAGSGRKGRALAAGAGVGDPKDGLVAVTTGALGADSNRLVLVDTNKKKLMVYRLRPNYMRLIAVRTYKYDLKLESVTGSPGNGYSFEATRDIILKSKMKKEDKESMPRGKEMVLTSDGVAQDGNRIVLINPTEKRILVYRLNGNILGLIAARRFEYDQQLEYTKGFAPGDGWDYKTIKAMVERMLKAQLKGAGND